MRCPHFTKECKDGYVAYIRNTCTCRCPKGLDPETGCTTVYHGGNYRKKTNDITKSVRHDWKQIVISMF
jgi:hypothetical protein